MDDASVQTLSDTYSRREKRWSLNSMSSQRLEEIVAELMKPIGDLRKSFDTDLCSLLEEYLTEAGLRALDSNSDSSTWVDTGGLIVPKFSEIALLLQQSASIWGHKVDFLYQHVLDVSDSLAHTTSLEKITRDDVKNASSGRKRRKIIEGAEFAPINVEAGVGLTRENEVPRPPPTLPRLYLELEPRAISDRDAPLRDYAGESVGLLRDFQVTWRLQGGLLVDELLMGDEPAAALTVRPVPLLELQATLESVARTEEVPQSLISPQTELLRPLSSLSCTPMSQCSVETPETLITEIIPRKPTLKRKMEDPPAGVGFALSAKKIMKCRSEFALPKSWIEDVVKMRRSEIIRSRRSLCYRPGRPPPQSDLRGFYSEIHLDIGGFVGWSQSQIESAVKEVNHYNEESYKCNTLTNVTTVMPFDMSRVESDDDGFFEQSSLEDTDPANSPLSNIAGSGGGGSKTDSGISSIVTSWHALVGARVLAAEARGALDVRVLSSRVIDALPKKSNQSPKSFNKLLKCTAKEQHDVSRVLLATLFLANAGNVEIINNKSSKDWWEPPSDFSLRLLNDDERLYCAAIEADAPQPHSQLVGDR